MTAFRCILRKLRTRPVTCTTQYERNYKKKTPHLLPPRPLAADRRPKPTPRLFSTPVASLWNSRLSPPGRWRHRRENKLLLRLASEQNVYLHLANIRRTVGDLLRGPNSYHRCLLYVYTVSDKISKVRLKSRPRCYYHNYYILSVTCLLYIYIRIITRPD